jgi:hypothetical protein
MADAIDAQGAPRSPAPPQRLRLYRGLTRPYDPARVRGAAGTDFTDCPFTALRYAAGSKGVVLVLEAPLGPRRVTEELWLDSGARRYMVWGAFDDLLLAELPAKELRARVGGVVAMSDAYKASVLRRAIAERLSRS